MKTESKSYPIRTLGDIFRLPTKEMMETALDEISHSMKQARAFQEVAQAIAKSKGIEAEAVLEWPEITEWVDDGKSEVGFSVISTDGQRIECFGTMPKTTPPKESDTRNHETKGGCQQEPCSAILAANATALLIAGIRADIIMFAAIIMALDSDNRAFSMIMLICSFFALLGGFRARWKHDKLVRRQNAAPLATQPNL